MSGFKSTCHITNVSYKLLTDDIKKKISVVEITNKSSFIGEEPVNGGIYDSRMGTTRDYPCGTCLVDRMDVKKCPGHFGRIMLNYPVKEPLFINDLITWLNIVCSKCSAPLISPEKFDNKDMGDRFKAFKEDALKATSCYKCGKSRSLKIIPNKFSPLNFMRGEKKINNMKLRSILMKISNRLITFLGLNMDYHPKHFITEVILVSPPNTRLEIMSTFNKVSSTSDLTKLYSFIIEANNKIPIEEDGKRQEKIIDNMESYYYHLLLGDPDSKHYQKIENSGQQQLKSIIMIVKSKEGLFRRNTQGKKLEKIARSVIVGESNIIPGNLVISQEMAKNMYQQRKVTSMNIIEMTGYFINDDYPGVRYVQRGDKIFNAKTFKKNNNIMIGDVIYRHLVDGDDLLFNRMPSLSWGSLSSHSIRVIPDENAFRFNEAECVHFNADFDGDEMNTYLVNNTVSRVELKIASNLHSFSISYANGVCVIGLKEDAILGIGLMTRTGVEFTLKEAYSLFAQTTINPNVRLFKRHKDYKGKVTDGMLSGRDVISILLLTMGCHINYTHKSRSYITKMNNHLGYVPEDELVVIEDGNLLSGIMDKPITDQNNYGSPFHIIYNEYSTKTAVHAAYNMQQIGIAYLAYRGFTIGIKDAMLDPKVLAELQGSLKVKMDKSIELHNRYINNKLIAPINKTVNEYYEQEQISILSIGQSFYDTMLSGLIPDSAFLNMANIGSKGNLNQLRACIALRGQAFVRGQRLRKECNGRSFPHSTKDSFDPRDRGFIINNLGLGLNNKDTIGDAQEERNGIIDKSQETSVAGYFSRLLTKSTENEIVNNNFGIASAEKNMQLLFGGDGLDIRSQEINKINIYLSDDEMKDEYLLTFVDINKAYHNPSVEKILTLEFQDIMNSRDYLRDVFIKMELSEDDKSFDGKVKLPMNIERIIYNNLKLNDTSDVFDPVLAYEDIRKMIKDMERIMTNRTCDLPTPKYVTVAFSKIVSCIHLLISLKMLVNKKISNDTLKFILNDILILCHKALVNPGTNTGTIQSQSLGSPATQATLNSIHGSNNKGGIQNIKNITHIRKYSYTATNEGKKGLINPYMRFELLEGADYEMFANSIEMKKLKFFIKTIEVMDRDIKHSGSDQTMVDEFLKNNIPKNISRFCVRMELDKIELFIKGLSIDEIAINLYAHFNDIKVGELKMKLDVYLIYSSMEDEKIVLLLYLVIIPTKVDLKVLIDLLKTNIKRCIVSGKAGINKADVRDHMRLKIHEDGSAKKELVKYISTDGINIKDIYNHPLVKRSTFVCNSMLDMNDSFGIIAAENAILSELRIQAGAEALDVRHYINIAKSMTIMGVPLPNTYYGIKKRFNNNIGLLVCTESVTKTLQLSVRESKSHGITGITDSCFYNVTLPFGTNYNKVIMNRDFIRSNNKTVSSLMDDLLA